jgi:transposase
MKKVSATKIYKVVTLHVQGFSQTTIAKMLHVDQTTVWKYVGAFQALAEQMGIQNALLEYEVQNDPEETQAVVEEFRESDLSIASVKTALQVYEFLQWSGVEPDDYYSLVHGIKKATDAGYAQAAAELSTLEKDTGKKYKEIITSAKQSAAELDKSGQELDEIGQSIKSSKLTLAGLEQTEAKASTDLKKHLEQVGVDEQRLKKVETLALALKDADIPDQELSVYVDRQGALNKAGLSINTFHEIVDKAKVAAADDGGQLLLGMLAEYGGLAAVIKTQKVDKEQLGQTVSDLGEKVHLRDELIQEIGNLEAARDNLKPLVLQLNSEATVLGHKLFQLKGDIKASLETRSQLTHEIHELEMLSVQVVNVAKQLKAEVADLEELKWERDGVAQNLSKLQTETKKEGRRWQVFDGFLGIVQAQSRDDLRKAVSMLPELLDEIEEGKYSADFLSNFVLEQLAGPKLRIMRCVYCGTRFPGSSPEPDHGYVCPMSALGGPHQIVVDKDAAAILGALTAGPKPALAVSMISIIKLESGPKPAGQA